MRWRRGRSTRSHRHDDDRDIPSLVELRRRAAEVGVDLPLTRAERAESDPPAPAFSFLPQGWEDYRPARRLSDLDPDKLMARDLRRRSDRVRLEAALGFDQELMRRLGV